jgi:uncharacterized alpha-E superfamily protein
MMLSRIADNLFWLNRYMERVDALARSTRYFYILGFDTWEGETLGYAPLLKCFTSASPQHILEVQHSPQAVLQWVIADGSNPNSLKALVGKARENARASQDKITKEVWEQVNALYHFIRGESIGTQLAGEGALPVLDKLEKECLLYHGIIDATMPRGLAWEFMNIGRFLERSLLTIDFLQAYLEPMHYNLQANDDMLYWRRLLYALSGYELYLKTNRGSQHTKQVIYQAIMNNHFPHSILYSLQRANKYVDAVLEQNAQPAAEKLGKQFGRLKSPVEFMDLATLDGETLHAMLAGLRRQILDFSMDFSKIYFSYT